MKALNFNKSDLRLAMERISNFTEIQGDLQNFENEFFEFCDGIWGAICVIWDDWNDLSSDERENALSELYAALFTLKAVLRREELFSGNALFIGYKKALQFATDLADLERR